MSGRLCGCRSAEKHGNWSLDLPNHPPPNHKEECGQQHGDRGGSESGPYINTGENRHRQSRYVGYTTVIRCLTVVTVVTARRLDRQAA